MVNDVSGEEVRDGQEGEPRSSCFPRMVQRVHTSEVSKLVAFFTVPPLSLCRF